MKIVTEHVHDASVCVVKVLGDIDMVTTPDVQLAVESAVNRGCVNVVLDLARVTYADSTALGLIVWMDRLLEPKGGRLILAGADRNVARILELSGLIGAAHTVSSASSAAEALVGLGPVEQAGPALWVREFSYPAMPESLAEGRTRVCEAIEPLGMAESALFDVRVAIGEALSNAIRHGSSETGADTVSVSVSAFDDRVVVEVRDQGVGFDGSAVPDQDPYAASGRGVMFMRALMDRVDFAPLAGGGTAVTLVKHR
ncbi:MAG: anti-sigma factor antagonist [Aeromicrobium sp.]|jgi:anti-anti-sigma factor|nr:anti-sigma factor antagonist [Aeromicrobium sp.]